jgi:predicted metal-binding membrane protein
MSALLFAVLVALVLVVTAGELRLIAREARQAASAPGPSCSHRSAGVPAGNLCPWCAPEEDRWAS